MDWWTAQQAGLVGAVIGAGLGGVMMGAIGGGVCGPLVGKGLARSFVLTYFGLLALIGLGIAAAGVYALAIGQPFHVWFWLLQPGLLVGGLAAAFVPLMGRAYRRHEVRRLAAEEFRRS